MPRVGQPASITVSLWATAPPHADTSTFGMCCGWLGACRERRSTNRAVAGIKVDEKFGRKVTRHEAVGGVLGPLLNLFFRHRIVLATSLVEKLCPYASEAKKFFIAARKTAERIDTRAPKMRIQDLSCPQLLKNV